MSSEMWNSYRKSEPTEPEAEQTASVHSSGLLYIPAHIRRAVFNGTDEAEIQYATDGSKIRLTPAPGDRMGHKITDSGLVSVYGVLNQIGVGIPSDRFDVPVDVVDGSLVADFSDVNGGGD